MEGQDGMTRMKTQHWIIIALAGLAAFLIWDRSRLANKLDSTSSVLNEKTDSIRYWRSKSGKIVSEKTAAEISRQDLKDHYPEIAKELQELKIKIKEARAILKASIEAHGSGVVRIVRDTIVVPGQSVRLQDSIFMADGYLDLKSDGFRYAYTYSDTITATISGKRNGLFGKEKLIGSFKLANPNARAVSQTAILIDERKVRRFYVGVGLNYNPFMQRVTPGIQAGFKLIQF